MHLLSARPFLWLAALFFAPLALAHPIPDIPVRSSFEASGACRIQVAVDPRCFEPDPNVAPSVLHDSFKLMEPKDRQALLDQAKAYVAKRVEFFYEPKLQIVPEFTYEFTTHNGAPLTKDDDVMVMTGTWKTTVPAGVQGYRIRSTPESTLSVMFLNTINGQQLERIAVLFPSETSFILDIANLSASVPTGPIEGAIGLKEGSGKGAVFIEFVRQGFVHVVPMGLDHILFVLGIFLLSRSWKPLLLQVTTFTVAHTLTLGLATLGWVNVSGDIVEPIIAGSIAVVALENIVRPRYTHWRLLLVFIFGLVHGLGFAGALKELELPTASLIIGLLGFNVGVEGGQLAVIAVAFLATIWIRNPKAYRWAIVVPGSLAIAGMGLYWMAERVGWIQA